MKNQCNVVFVGFFLFSALFLLSEKTLAQQRREIAAKVEAVTVFLNRAQVTNTARTNVPAGLTEIALSNIPNNLDVNSIQVAARGNVIVTGVKFENNHLKQQVKSREILAAEDSAETYQSLVRMLTDQIDVYRKEEAMVQANQSIGGQKGVIMEDLEDVADFFRTRLFTIRGHIQQHEKRLAKANANLNRFQNQLWELNNQRPKATGNILVYVSSEKAANVSMEVSYMVYNAGWQPFYDLRATNTKNPVKLVYKANVYQNTSVEWPDVNLTLSTINPAIGANKPELSPWYLSLPEKVRKQAVMKVQKAEEASGLTEEEMSLGATDESDGWGAEAPAAGSAADYTAAVQTELAVNFQIKMPYSIPADNKPIAVDIQEFDLPATFIHAAVPKMDNTAFLMAQLTNWEQYNLLPGEASIFFENTFTGKTILDPALSDTLSFSLGRDKKVMIQHEKIKELKSKNFLGSNAKETSGYEITVRNTKDQPIIISLEDQIPVSQNSEIEVELLESSGGVLNKETGKVTWQLTLKPQETKKLQLKFEVKSPKGKQVIGM